MDTESWVYLEKKTWKNPDCSTQIPAQYAESFSFGPYWNYAMLCRDIQLLKQFWIESLSKKKKKKKYALAWKKEQLFNFNL